jgi:hypothetical protein
MDHLAAISGTFVDHNNNFNHGDCGVYTNVLDYEGTLTRVDATYPVNTGDDHRHPDKINLMLESTTASFGYFNSNGSVRRTEYTGLVSYQTIIDVLGSKANCLNDGWNRSFMGFDFEQMIEEEMYATGDNAYATYAGPATEGRIWDGTSVTNTISSYDQNNNWAPIWADGYEHMMYNGAAVRCLSSDMNRYCGDLIEYNSDDDIVIEINGYGKCLNMKKINDDLLSQGYLPVAGSSLKKWVKLGGCADEYYSDWIVTLTEAKKYTTTPPPSDWDIRIIAEDLNATAQTTPAAEDGFDESDWDFNDVVFDVKFTSQTTANVKIVGAGGVLPLYVAEHEAHQELGQSGPDANGYYRIQNSGDATPFEVTGINKSNNGKDIVIKVVRVSSTGDPIISELTAPNGKPAAKLGVDPRFTPCAEREDIRIRYPKFMEWVQTNFSGTWYDIEINN